jgi:hypothetical protein
LNQTLHTVEFELTEDLVSDFTRLWIDREVYPWRRTLPQLALAIVLAACIILLGLNGWIAPIVAGGLMLILAFPVGVAMVRRRSMHIMATWTTLFVAQQGGDRRVRVHFGDERIQMETGMGETGAAWKDLDEVVIFPGFWVLRCMPLGQFMVPASALTPEVDAFIRGKAHEVSAVVREG